MTKEHIKKLVMNPIKSAGFDVFFVGGCVRDSILGIEPKDFDISTNATPTELHNIFDKFSNVSKNSEPFGVTIILIPTDNGLEEIEIATFRKDISKGRHPKIEFSSDITEDANRRDFTVNALFEDIDGTIIDPTRQGLNDIKTKTLRFIGNPLDRVNEDPLRIFRFVRFLSQKGFKATNVDCLKELVKQKGLKIFEQVSRERVLKEFQSMIVGSFMTLEIFELADKLGMFEKVGLKESFDFMESCEQTPKWHSEGNVLNHTKLVFDAGIKESQDMNKEDKFVFLMGCLLHDIGKPKCKELFGFRSNGLPVTKNHAFIGADLVPDICNKMGLSNDETKRVKNLVKNHMLMHEIPKLSKNVLWGLLSNKDFSLLVKLCRADSAGCIKTCIDEELPIDEALQLPHVKELVGVPLPRPLVTGQDFINLGFKPSEKFKKALEVAFKIQINQGLDKEHILKQVKPLLK